MTRSLAIVLAAGLALAIACQSTAAAAAAGDPAGGATPAMVAKPTATVHDGGARPADATAAGGADEALLREVRENRARLFDSQIDVPPPSAPSVDLEEAMRRLREAVARPIAKPKSADAAEVAPTPGADSTVAGDAAGAAEAPAETPVLSPEELARVKDLSLERLGEPMALADALFLGGHDAEAAALYERLLADGSLGGTARAWALYQAANCKRQGDASAALVLYDRLLTEHPESPWVDPAKVRKTLLQWQTQTQPQTLLAPLHSAAASSPATTASAANTNTVTPATNPTEGARP